MKQLLCYGDSNTWGLIPGTKERYPWGVRWTSILQEKLGTSDVHVIEERKGLATLPLILESQYPVDAAVLMLGTNDCKSYYHNSPYIIAKGVSQCVDELLKYVSAENVLIISPIHLGTDVWEERFDPEFDQKSVEISKELKKEYQKIAKQKQVHFLAASDFVNPSDEDREHMDEKGHAVLAEQILRVLQEKQVLE